MSRYTKANHHVYMRFEFRQRWHVTFLEAGLETELPRKLTIESPGKILELARKGEAWSTLENRQALERAIRAGKGGCYLGVSGQEFQIIEGYINRNEASADLAALLGFHMAAAESLGAALRKEGRIGMILGLLIS